MTCLFHCNEILSLYSLIRGVTPFSPQWDLKFIQSFSRSHAFLQLQQRFLETYNRSNPDFLGMPTLMWKEIVEHVLLQPTKSICCHLFIQSTVSLSRTIGFRNFYVNVNENNQIDRFRINILKIWNFQQWHATVIFLIINRYTCKFIR